MSKITDKRRIDTLLAQSDRMRFCNKIGLINLSDNICKIYEYNFFNLYKELLIKKSVNTEVLNELRKDFRRNLYILLRQQENNIKTKISFILFSISPKVYVMCFS